MKDSDALGRHDDVVVNGEVGLNGWTLCLLWANAAVLECTTSTTELALNTCCFSVYGARLQRKHVQVECEIL